MPLYEGLLGYPVIYWEVRGHERLWDMFGPVEEAYLASGRLMPASVPEPAAVAAALALPLLLGGRRRIR